MTIQGGGGGGYYHFHAPGYTQDCKKETKTGMPAALGKSIGSLTVSYYQSVEDVSLVSGNGEPGARWLCIKSISFVCSSYAWVPGAVPRRPKQPVSSRIAIACHSFLCEFCQCILYSAICTATICNRHAPAPVHDAAGPPKNRREIKVYRHIDP